MIRSLDRPLLALIVALSIAGVLILYSSGVTDQETMASGLWRRQMMWLGIGSIAAVLAMRTSFRLIEWATPWLYGFGLVLLVLLLVGLGGGAGTAESSKSWLTIAGFRIGQPSEFAKVATILMLARWFAARRDPPRTLRQMLPPILIAAVPMLLVAAGKDLGSALVFGGILLASLFWAGVPPSLLLLFVSPAISLVLSFNTAIWSAWMVLLFGLLLVWRPFLLESIGVYLANAAMGVLSMVVWNTLQVHQRNRILSYLNPKDMIDEGGYQAYQSQVAIGSGGWFGNGYTLGTQKRSGYIPEHGTDFVFAVVGEELGFIGVIVSLLLLFGLLFVLIRIARRTSDPFASLIVAGAVGLFFTHIFENVGMTVSLTPITGIPLPFFSHGGSFLLTTFLLLGMAFRAAAEARAAGYVNG